MDSLDTILERNRKKARNLMLDNNVTHISITDNEVFGQDTDVPFVILRKKDRETYDTQVAEIKLDNCEIFIKVFNAHELPSDMFVNEEEYIRDVDCLSYSANEIYCAIEYYFDNYLYLDDKIYNLNKEFEQKFADLLSDENENSFTFKECDMFCENQGGIETNIKDIYMEGRCVMLKTDEGIIFYLFSLDLETKCKLLKHFVDCLKDKC